MAERAKSPRTLAAFMYFLREERQPLGVMAFAADIGYSKSTIYYLEDLEYLRTQYKHIEVYADYFGIPSGVMLLMTRLAAKAKMLRSEALPDEERAELESELKGLLNGIEGIGRATPSARTRSRRSSTSHVPQIRKLTAMIDAAAKDPRRAYFPVFQHLLKRFETTAGGLEQFRYSSPRHHTRGGRR